MSEPRLRLLFETVPTAGAWNMALDEALLEHALTTGDAVLRWYRWDSATLSLGYFQPASEAAATPLWADLPRVPPLSGGGAILHHHEWTYSCVLPPTHPFTANPHNLYLIIHRSIIAHLATLGFETYLRGDAAPSTGQPEAFLCFQRGDPCDVHSQGQKVLGSAQRRRRGAVLQHGSLILRQSPFAPLIPGLFDLAGKSTEEMNLGESLARPVAEQLLWPATPDTPSPSELEQAAQLLKTRYAERLDWNRSSPGNR